MPPIWDPDEALLRTAGDNLRHQLGLDAALQLLGKPTLVGSAALRVLVARDLDLTVAVAKLDPVLLEQVAALARTLTLRSDVSEVLMRNDTGRWNTDPSYPDGLYLRVTCADLTDAQWTVDLWFVDEPHRQPDLAHVRDLAPRITPAVQSDILRIKRAQIWRRTDGTRLPSLEIYRAVLDAHVRDPDGYRTYLTDRRLLEPDVA